jgi:tetratricopeptide (TPR) repeat protein
MNAPAFSVMQAMHNASALLQAGQFAQARTVLEAVLRSAPGFVEAYRLLAGAQLALGDRADAERTLRAAAAIDARWAPVQVALGELLAENGNLVEAEAALRGGHASANNYPRATTSLAAVLLRAGKPQEALDIIAAPAAHAKADAHTLELHAQALLALRRSEAAIEPLARLARLRPDDAQTHLLLAGALLDAARHSEAAQVIRRAMELGIASAHAWFLTGSAAAGENRYADAEAAFGEAARLEPAYLDAQRELAQMIWMRTGDIRAASAQLDVALSANPDAQEILALKATLHLGVGDAAGAFALLADAAAREDARPMLLLGASTAALQCGSPRAFEFAERAVAKLPGDLPAMNALADALLAAGRAADVERLAADMLRQRPDDQHAIALQTTAQRLLGNDAYRATCDYAGLVKTWTIDTPPGWPDLPAYLADLALSLRRLHGLHTHPLYQSLRHGTQSTHNLMRSADPAIRAFFHAIDGPIRRHLQALGSGADPTRRRNNGNYRIHGIWSVQLQPNGYHTNHVHPEGWLSSACYIDLPPAIARGHEGWLKFGEPGVPTQPPLAPEHFVQPRPGLLALFPSHLWHGTVPFHGDGTRLTIAFDLVPA